MDSNASPGPLDRRDAAPEVRGRLCDHGSGCAGRLGLDLADPATAMFSAARASSTSASFLDLLGDDPRSRGPARRRGRPRPPRSAPGGWSGRRSTKMVSTMPSICSTCGWSAPSIDQDASSAEESASVRGSRWWPPLPRRRRPGRPHGSSRRPPRRSSPAEEERGPRSYETWRSAPEATSPDGACDLLDRAARPRPKRSSSAPLRSPGGRWPWPRQRGHADTFSVIWLIAMPSASRSERGSILEATGRGRRSAWRRRPSRER